MGVPCRVERIGTDGDVRKMIALIKELDGKVDAFGLGGIGLRFHAGKKLVDLREARQIVEAAKETPIVDGSGLKDQLGRRAVQHLQRETDVLAGSPRVLVTSGVDRFGLAEALNSAGCKMTFADLVFLVGLPITLHSMRSFLLVARLLVPPLSKLPFAMLYPTGEKQEEHRPKASRLFSKASIIAGDFLLINRYMPEDLRGKVVLTNTTTADDVELLRQRGVKTLVTTTPVLDGRSFGVNAMEALLVAVSGKGRQLTESEYDQLLARAGFEPQVLNLSQ